MKYLKTFEEKGEKWIQDAIKKPGSLRKQLGKEKGEKITKSEIASEISNLKKKDKDPKKEGIQGLSKKDLKKLRRLNLAKTLRGMNENMDDMSRGGIRIPEVETPEMEIPSEELRNYMFFNNLRKMKSEIEEILSLDEKMVDDLLCDGHDWADDHISVAKENIDHVYNFLVHSEK
jgi:hypothetical protein